MHVGKNDLSYSYMLTSKFTATTQEKDSGISVKSSKKTPAQCTVAVMRTKFQTVPLIDLQETDLLACFINSFSIRNMHDGPNAALAYICVNLE